MKEKYTIEFALRKGSAKSLWKLISTPQGLSEWVADRVDRQGDVLTFYWNRDSEQARFIREVPEVKVRYHWLKEPEETYFELEIVKSELTGELSLMLTDFASPDEREDMIYLWTKEIDRLVRRLGL